jgi:hypothetical protein
MKKLLSISALILIAIFMVPSNKKAVADTWNGVQAFTYSFTNVTQTGTGYLKQSPAYLHTVTINHPVASAVFVLSDTTQYGGASSTSAPIATITMPGTLLNNGPITATYDIQTVNGLTYYSTAAAEDVTIAWK